MANGNVIELIVQAIDNASSVINGVGKTIDDVGKKSKASLNPIASASDVATQAFGKLKAAAAGIGVALGAGQLFNKFIAEAGAAEMASVRLGLAYQNIGAKTGLTRKELDDFGKTIQQTTMFTDEAVSGLQETLFRFSSITGNTFKRTQQVVVDLAAAMGTDLSSAAQQVGRALESPSTGLRILRQAGVVLTEAQKDLIKSLEESGNKAEAQNIILGELEKRYKGTAEVVANTLTGSLKQLSIAYDDLFESTNEAASATTKMVQDMTAALRDPSVKESFDNLFALFAALVKTVAGAVYGLGLLAGAIKSVFESAPQSKEVLAAWDDQSKAVADYTDALRVLNDVKSRPNDIVAIGGGNFGKARELIPKYEKELADANKRVVAAQAKVNAAMAKDPFSQNAVGDAAQERAAKIYAETEKKAAEVLAVKEAALAKATAAAEKYTKANNALVESINQESNATLAAIETYSGAVRDAPELPPLELPDLSALQALSEQYTLPMPKIDLGAVEESVSEAQKVLDALTAPTLEAVSLQIQIDAGQIDAIPAKLQDIIIGIEDIVRTPVEVITEKFDDLRASIQEAISLLPEGSAEIQRLQELIPKLAEKQAQEIKDAGDKMSVYAEQAAKNMQTAFADFLFDPFENGIKGMLKGFLDIIRRMIAEQVSAKLFESSGVKNFIANMVGTVKPEAAAAQAATAETTTAVAAVTNPLFDGLKSIFGPFITGIGSVFKGFLPMLSNVFSGLFNGLTSILGSIFGGGSSGSGILGAILSIFGASAGGGIAKSNSFRVVGEAGPELVYTGTSGINVKNMRQMAFAGGSGGGGSVNYSPSNTIVIQGSADEKSRAEMMMMIQRNNQQQMVAINDMLYNNGMGRMR